MKRIQVLFLISCIFILCVPISAHAKKKSSVTIWGYPPHIAARDIGFGLALTGGAALVASGVLGIVILVERGRFEEHFRNARTHEEFVALNDSYDMGVKISYYANVLLGIGIVQTSIGLGFCIAGLVIDAQQPKKQYKPDTPPEPVLVQKHTNDWIIARVGY